MTSGDDEDSQYWWFSIQSRRSGTIYTPAVMVECMGRVWALERNMFHYSLCPRDRYSSSNMREYRREWDYRVEESRQLRQNLRQRGLRRPRQRSLQVPRDNDESLELAINIVRHENNQMQIRINRYDNFREVESRGIERLRQYITADDLTDEE
jgi:hypothetical protein